MSGVFFGSRNDPPPQAQPCPQCAEKDREIDEERKRRRFVSFHGRYLGWGLVGPNREPGVVLTLEHSHPTGLHSRYVALYADHAGDHEATERAVIDEARKATDEGREASPFDGGFANLVQELWLAEQRAEQAEAERDALAARAVRQGVEIKALENLLEIAKALAASPETGEETT